ncbi:uncharacterized protein LOC120990586 [Bufo bufo]|uniref:uncharacterized protein LOC120990586 n=1 Tax=Bufo bufo TaxID=8384 RepID=UPI001ABE9682|nr:uncharacterized protein LOC120990586 [Bufo bufo]
MCSVLGVLVSVWGPLCPPHMLCFVPWCQVPGAGHVLGARGPRLCLGSSVPPSHAVFCPLVSGPWCWSCARGPRLSGVLCAPLTCCVLSPGVRFLVLVMCSGPSSVWGPLCPPHMLCFVLWCQVPGAGHVLGARGPRLCLGSSVPPLTCCVLSPGVRFLVLVMCSGPSSLSGVLCAPLTCCVLSPGVRFLVLVMSSVLGVLVSVWGPLCPPHMLCFVPWCQVPGAGHVLGALVCLGSSVPPSHAVFCPLVSGSWCWSCARCSGSSSVWGPLCPPHMLCFVPWCQVPGAGHVLGVLVCLGSSVPPSHAVFCPLVSGPWCWS